MEEEREAKELLTHLEDLGSDHPEFAEHLDVLRTSVLAHARAEEREEFTALQQVADEATLRGMAAGIRAAEAMAPTHPHPSVETGTENVLMGAGGCDHGSRPRCGAAGHG